MFKRTKNLQYYTKLQANYVLYYKRMQLYYNTLHYAWFPFLTPTVEGEDRETKPFNAVGFN